MKPGDPGRERVLTALAHQQPDRCPVDLWAEPKVWDRLIRGLGVPDRDAVCDRLEVDVRYISPVYPDDVVRNGIKQNMWGERWEISPTPWGEDWEHIAGALNAATSVEDLRKFRWPTPDDVDYSTIKSQRDRYQGHAIAFGNADIFERPALTRTWEGFFLDLHDHPDMVAYLQQVFLDFYVEDFLRTMEAANGQIDIYYALTDLGTQDGLIQSMASFDQFIAPPIQRLGALVHQHGVKFMFHSCGAIREAIPALIDCGVDILNPLQPAAKGMEPEGLKRDFGRQLCFHGGIDVQYLLPQATPAAVRQETRRRVEILGKNGGYIVAPSHNFQLDIPLENMLAMYDLDCRA